MIYNREDMIDDDGYGTWDEKRLDEEYRKLKEENKKLKEMHKAPWAYVEVYVERIEKLEDKYFKKYDSVSDFLKQIKPKSFFLCHQSIGTDKSIIHTFERVPVDRFLDESWVKKEVKLRINEDDEIELYYSHKSIYAPTSYYLTDSYKG